MKREIYILFSCLMAVLCSCSSKDFTIEGKVEGLGTQNLRIMYLCGGELNTRWLPAVDGEFTVKGRSPEMTVVEILNRRMEVIARVATRNGETTKITGTTGNIAIKGNKLTRRWSEWLAANPEGEDRDRAIEKYALENRDDMLAVLLVAYNYSTPATYVKAAELMDTLVNVPQFAQLRMSTMVDVAFAQRDTVPSYNFNIYSTADTTEHFKISDSRVNLIHIWKKDDAGRKNVVKELKKFRSGDKRSTFRVVDIASLVDTFEWKNIVRQDSTEWKRYWAPGGRINTAINGMRVDNLPVIMVVDSAGNKLYSGVEVDSAKAVVNRVLKK